MVKTLYEVEQAIAQYEEHIKKLEQITQEGSVEGRQAAIVKLKKVREDLGLLLKQRERLTKGGSLSGFSGVSNFLGFGNIDPPRAKIISMLHKLLLDEYLQRDVYETYSYYLFGLCSPALQNHLREHRKQEDAHISTLHRYLMSLRAEPMTKRLPVPKIAPPIGNLLYANLVLENEAVINYSDAIMMLDAMGDPRFISLKVSLENILVEEQEHVHDLQQWLRIDTYSQEADAADKIC